MSGGWIAVGVAAAATAASSVYSSHQQSKAQRSAAKQQAEASANALKEQQTQFNKENQNQVDISGILAGQESAGSGSATMLTGPAGVGKNNLLLGGGSGLLGG